MGFLGIKGWAIVHALDGGRQARVPGPGGTTRTDGRPDGYCERTVSAIEVAQSSRLPFVRGFA
jgi:hypothetical protein